MTSRLPSAFIARDKAPTQRYVTLQLDIVSGLLKQLGELTHQRRFGLSVRDVRLILQVFHHPGLTIGQLVALSHMEKSLVSRSVTRLAQRRLMQRQIDRRDARQVNLMLTEEGAEIARQISQYAAEATRQHMSHFCASDREAFDRVLDGLAVYLEQRLAQVLAETAMQERGPA